jgi:hypothetical protein
VFVVAHDQVAQAVPGVRSAQAIDNAQIRSAYSYFVGATRDMHELIFELFDLIFEVCDTLLESRSHLRFD